MQPAAAQTWKHVATEAGIAITSLTANVPVLVHGQPWADARERLTRSLALAGELQGVGERMPVSLTASGPAETQASMSVSSAEAWTTNRELVIERFGDLAGLAAGFGARVALEPHFATVVCNKERALEVLSAVASPSLG